MATVQLKVKATYKPSESGQTKVETPAFEKNISMSGDDLAVLTQQIGTTEEQVDKGDITTPGIMVVQNIGSNFIELGTTSGTYGVKVKAGETQAFRPDGSTIYAKADTAAVRIKYWLFED